MTPEFSRSYRLDSLGGLKTLEIEASADERAALAQRFGLQDVAELKALYELDSFDDAVEAIRRDKAWNEEAARKQLLKFFEAWGFTDPATLAGRRKLSTLLFR